MALRAKKKKEIRDFIRKYLHMEEADLYELVQDTYPKVGMMKRTFTRWRGDAIRREYEMRQMQARDVI